jgi:hypothetical protein
MNPRFEFCFSLLPGANARRRFRTQMVRKGTAREDTSRSG